MVWKQSAPGEHSKATAQSWKGRRLSVRRTRRTTRRRRGTFGTENPAAGRIPRALADFVAFFFTTTQYLRRATSTATRFAVASTNLAAIWFTV